MKFLNGKIKCIFTGFARRFAVDAKTLAVRGKKSPRAWVGAEINDASGGKPRVEPEFEVKDRGHWGLQVADLKHLRDKRERKGVTRVWSERNKSAAGFFHKRQRIHHHKRGIWGVKRGLLDAISKLWAPKDKPGVAGDKRAVICESGGFATRKPAAAGRSLRIEDCTRRTTSE